MANSHSVVAGPPAWPEPKTSRWWPLHSVSSGILWGTCPHRPLQSGYPAGSDQHSTCKGRRCRAPSWDMWLHSVSFTLPQSHQSQQDELSKVHWSCDHSMWCLSCFRKARTDESCFPRDLCLPESNPSSVKKHWWVFSLFLVPNNVPHLLFYYFFLLREVDWSIQSLAEFLVPVLSLNCQQIGMLLREFGVHQQLIMKYIEVHKKPGCGHLAELENQIKTSGLHRTCIFSCKKLENSVYSYQNFSVHRIRVCCCWQLERFLLGSMYWWSKL